ncbi:MAG: siroheme synthase CysG [Pseudomonadota bacterium]
MNKFPAYIDLVDRPILIIGGGEAALRKARLMIAAQAAVTLAWPDIDQAVRAELDGRAALETRLPNDHEIAAARLVIVALEDDAEATHWAQKAKAAGALVNVVDQPALCDFITPSIIDRGRVVVAISTDGAAPVLGRNLRRDIEALAPSGLGALADFSDEYRDAVKARFSPDERRAFWEAFFAGPIAARVLSGDMGGAHEAMIEAVNRPLSNEDAGVVHIVGAGPGDPELLTIRALRLIQTADVLVYDRLVSDDILNLARRDADRVYVGKEKGNHSVPQQEIEARLIALAQAGKMVVRLKGGDPFVFGRGGEELDAVRAAGVPAFVTPGVTAATGCAAAAGLPLTHRDYAQSVTFVTGHGAGDDDPDLDWAALAALKNTLVVYMGVGKAARIAEQLIAHGRGASTPAAVIEKGTRADQKIVKGALTELPALIERGAIKGPALLVIGEVAALADARTLKDLVNQERLVA